MFSSTESVSSSGWEQVVRESRRLLEGRFEAAPLDLIAQRRLLERVDSKFVVPPILVPRILELLPPQYQLVRAGHRALASYRTRYFDTPTIRFYEEQRRRCVPRHKVRIRSYPEQGRAYLELKIRNHRARTRKYRCAVSPDLQVLGRSHYAALRRYWPELPSPLGPKVETTYQRSMLLSSVDDERVSFDFDVAFLKEGQDPVRFGDAIVEVKQQRRNEVTPVMRVLRHVGAQPAVASKYYLAMRAMHAS